MASHPSNNTTLATGIALCQRDSLQLSAQYGPSVGYATRAKMARSHLGLVQRQLAEERERIQQVNIRRQEAQQRAVGRKRLRGQEE